MTDFERIQSIQFLCVLAGFEPKLRFLISKYPPVCLKSKAGICVSNPTSSARKRLIGNAQG